MRDHPVHIPTRHQFYVYEIIDPRNRQVFYIGAGSGRRWRHSATNKRGSKRARLLELKAAGLKAIPRIVTSFSSWHDALLAEFHRQKTGLGLILSEAEIDQALADLYAQKVPKPEWRQNRSTALPQPRRPPVSSWCGHPDYKRRCPVLPLYCVPQRIDRATVSTDQS